MPDDPRVQELLDDLFDQDSTPEEVCRRCPELLTVVRHRWRQICRARDELDVMLPATPPDHAGGSSSGPPALPRLPGYEVESILGQGGMGIVFKARHRKLGRHVALKMSRAGSYASGPEQERFRREAESVAALRHANVVQIYDVGEFAGRPFFTMELMEGGSLTQRQAGAPQSAGEAAALVATLAEAVHAAHQGGIVHRDLKPANILFASDGTPKVTDFGLARRLEGGAELTLSGVPLGTPSYMAPEQARGHSREIGPAADVYALGAILYELLTGRPPFRGETSSETLLQVLHQEPVPPSRFNRRTPRDLQTICLTCLQKEPQLRYVTAALLSDDLQRFLRGEAIAARPEISIARWVRRIRRQPVLAAATALAAISTLAFAAGALWLVSDRSAKAEAASADVRDMRRHLNESSWIEASAARDRANGRLGDGAPAELRRSIDRGSRDLELARRLDEFQAQGIEVIAGGAPFENYHRGFMDALREAGLGTSEEDASAVAAQVRDSDIRDSLIAALDWYALMTLEREPVRSSWALEVARQTDPDQSTWRRRAREPSVLRDRDARNELMATRPLADPSLIPVTTLEAYASDQQLPVADRLALLKSLYQAHPDEFWINLRLGGFLRLSRMNNEALGYLQTAAALRPESAIARYQFGTILSDLNRREEAAAQFKKAAELNPATEIFHQFYVRRLMDLGQPTVAIEYLQSLLRAERQAAFAWTELGHCAERLGREAETIEWLTKAVEADPLRLESQRALRDYWLRRGKLNELQGAWRRALAHQPPQYGTWYGYPELALFLGDEEEYRRARREMLNRFGATTDPRNAETLSRTCLLRPVEGDELAAAVALSDRAVNSPAARSGGYYSYFLLARGLAEYRLGRLDQAIATLKGDASRVLGPTPRLVLAMAQHQKGLKHEARQTLAAAVPTYDWRLESCRNQDAWIYHILRREAERMILPDLPAFLAGTHRPGDNDERLALIGVCQFEDRSAALARIYEEAFAAAPGLSSSTNSHRYAAARAASRAAGGQGSDAAGLDDPERNRWRGLALQWLREELAAHSQALEKANEPARSQILQRVKQWQTEADFAGLRDAAALTQLPSADQERCRELWGDVKAMLSRTPSPR